MALRSVLHAFGLRYRLNARLIAGSTRTVDIAFSGARVAVFVDGCFWHGCPEHGSWPKANAQWWRAKIEANRVRDVDTTKRLEAQGWRVVRVWEHDDPNVAALDIAELVRRRAQDTKRR
jgi:DNA mismatch endonuclease, patch repair protein